MHTMRSEAMKQKNSATTSLAPVGARLPFYVALISKTLRPGNCRVNELEISRVSTSRSGEEDLMKIAFRAHRRMSTRGASPPRVLTRTRSSVSAGRGLCLSRRDPREATLWAQLGAAAARRCRLSPRWSEQGPVGRFARMHGIYGVTYTLTLSPGCRVYSVNPIYVIHLEVVSGSRLSE